jgi:hypothetical protein
VLSLGSNQVPLFERTPRLFLPIEGHAFPSLAQHHRGIGKSEPALALSLVAESQARTFDLQKAQRLHQLTLLPIAMSHSLTTD